MTVWSHLPTIFSAWRTLFLVRASVTIVVLITAIFFASIASAAPTTRTLTFQGRLASSSGAIVPDGHYNMQFKIYQGGTGATAGNPGGTLNWTESHVNDGGTGGILVRNGMFSVQLGSETPFGDSVNWDSDQLWLSMNVAGTASSCTTFGSGACAADGEMVPMKRITATPYSLNSGAVGGKSADELLQLGQGQQTDAGSLTSIDISKTGSGDFMRLQSSGSDALTIRGNGNIELGSLNDQSLSVAESSSGAGRGLSVRAGDGAAGSAGGMLTLQGGSSSDLAAAGGSVTIDSGTGNVGGSISLGSSNASNVNIGNDSSSTTVKGSLQAGTLRLGDNSANVAGTLEVDSGNGFVASLNGSSLTANRSISLPDESGTICLQGSGNCGFVRLSPPSAQTGNLWLSGGATFGADLSLRTTTNSSSALSVRTSGGTLVLGVSTSQQRVTIGTADTTATLLVLDTKTDSGDPTGVNGGMYYSSDRKKMRCYENGHWENCLSNTKGAPTTKTSAYTADYGDFVIADASGGSFVVTLPAPRAGATISVKKINSGSTNYVQVRCDTANIDNLTSTNMTTQWSSQDFYSDGTQWYRV